MPLVLHHHSGLRDIYSATLTAKTPSIHWRSGAVHSMFYSKTKISFVTLAIKIFSHPSIQNLVYGDAHQSVVARASSTRNPVLENDAIPLIHGIARADDGIKDLAQKSNYTREEHRLRGDVFHEVIQRLVRKEARNGTPASVNQDTTPDIVSPTQRHIINVTRLVTSNCLPNTFTRHLPFYKIKSDLFASFLRGNLNKALIGFFVILRRITTPIVKQPVTATALVFLQLIRHSVTSKEIRLAPELYRDK